MGRAPRTALAAGVLLGSLLRLASPALACVQTSDFRSPSDRDDTLSIEKALATGDCVHLVAHGRELVVSHDLVVRKPGQTVFGDGRLVTRVRSGDPRGFERGLFVAATGEPGPVFRDFGVFYDQPDTSDPKALIAYPPAFAMNKAPRFRMEHMGCYVATTCVEARENAGGAILQDVQLTAFATGIAIDDAYDSMRLENIHWGPFYLTEKQRPVFLTEGIGHAVGIRMGRADDFHVVDGTFFGGQGMEVRPSAKDGSVGFGSVRGCDFDTYSGLAIHGVGSVSIVGNAFTLGVEGTSLRLDDGLASVTGNKFLLAVPGASVVLNGGAMTAVGNDFASGGVDASAVRQMAGSRLVLDGNIVEKDAGRDYVQPVFALRGGRTTAMGNVVSALAAPHVGTAFAIDHDDAANRFIGNSAPGWRSSWPVRPSGVYRDN